jgi:hypothetical protein
MVENNESEYETLKNSYKSINVVLMFVGVVLGGYILSPGMKSLTLAIAVGATLFGAYNYKKWDGNGKWGYVLGVLAAVWAVVTIVVYVTGL